MPAWGIRVPASRASTERFLPYLPQLLVEWQTRDPSTTSQIVPGTLVFADISGFTTLSERLAARGKIGAEEITDILNSTFSELLFLARERGGDLIKFGGDALVIFFRGHEHALQACSAAYEMRRAIQRLGRLKTTAGRVALGISIGVHSGEFVFLLGGESHRELLIVGPAATRTVEMESAAEAGDILLSPEAAAMLPGKHVGSEKGPGQLLAGRPRGLTVETSVGTRTARHFKAEMFIPASLRQTLAGPAVEAEHRQATIAFIRIAGVDSILNHPGGMDELHLRLDRLLKCVQVAALEQGVALLATDISADGAKIILTAGVPVTSGADDEALLQAARRIVDGDYGLDLHVGINRGPIFAGSVGPDFRRTYTVIGDAVNLAARVMARAAPGEMLATEPVVERSNVVFKATELEPFHVKGKSELIRALSIGQQKGSRARYRRGHLPFIGREAERQKLLEAADAVLSGKGSVIEITGEAGIGKSRLLEELQQERSHLRRVSARCEPYESSTAYFPVRAILAAFLGTDDQQNSRARGRVLRRTITKLKPDLIPWLPLLASIIDADVPSTREAAEIKPEFRKARLHQITIELIIALATDPTLILVEDAHWADDASLELIKELARAAKSRPWLLIVTSRPRDEPVLDSGAKGTWLQLKPLAQEDAAKLVRVASRDKDLPQRQLAAIADRAGGNPLFLSELLAVSGGVDEAPTLPASIEAVITARIDSLPRDLRQLLRYASVVGPNVELALLHDLLPPNHNPLLQHGGLEPLRDAATVEGGVLRFNHSLFRDVAYEGLAYRDRRRLHGQVANLIEERAAEDADEVAELLSLHYYFSGNDRKAWQYSVLAGKRSQDKSANHEAADFYERALQVGQSAGADTDELGEVAECLGDAYEITAVYDRAQRAYRRARELLRQSPDRWPVLTLKQGVIQEHFGKYSQALRLYTRGLKQCRGQQEALLLTAYAGVRFRQGKYAECATLCRRVIAQTDAAADQSSLGHAYYLLDHALTFLRELDKPDYSSMALSIYEQLGDLVRVANVLNNMGINAYFRGDWDEALECYEQSRSARARSGDIVGEATQINNIGEILSDQGLFEEAERLFSEALATWRAARYPVGIALATSNLGRLAGRMGQLDRALRLLSEAEQRFQEIGATAFVLETQARKAEVLSYAGRAADALAVAREVLARTVPGTEVLQATTHRICGYALLQSGFLGEADEALNTSLHIAKKAGADYEVALTLEAMSQAALVTRNGNEAALLIEAWKILQRLNVRQTARVPVPGPVAKEEPPGPQDSAGTQA